VSIISYTASSTPSVLRKEDQAKGGKVRVLTTIKRFQESYVTSVTMSSCQPSLNLPLTRSRVFNSHSLCRVTALVLALGLFSQNLGLGSEV
jgi:hypothetical protein